jgi:ferritin-like metal-binding protein YciE
MGLGSMHDLLMGQLRDIYHAENQILVALPHLTQGVRSPALRLAFLAHQAETDEQVNRLEHVFAELGVIPTGIRSKGMEGSLAAGLDILNEGGPEAVIDAALIGALQRAAHHKIAGYGTILSFARLLGEHQVVRLLQASLDEAKAFDQELSDIAEDEVNDMALAAGETAGATEPTVS